MKLIAIDAESGTIINEPFLVDAADQQTRHALALHDGDDNATAQWASRHGIHVGGDGSFEVVVTGNPVDGFDLVGPFDDSDCAAEYAATLVTGAWTTTMRFPDNRS